MEFEIVRWVTQGLLAWAFLITGGRWLKALHLHRWELRRVARATFWLMCRTRYVLFYLGSLYVCGVGVYLMAAQGWWWLGWVGCASALLGVTFNSVPPAVLVLGGSNAGTYTVLSDVDRAIRPLRAVVLLAPPPKGPEGDARVAATADNFRTYRSEAWRTVVHRLIDLVPLVVIDLRTASLAVAEEVEWMLHPARVHKAVFVVADISGPALPRGVHSLDAERRIRTPQQLIRLLFLLTRHPDRLDAFHAKGISGAGKAPT